MSLSLWRADSTFRLRNSIDPTPSCTWYATTCFCLMASRLPFKCVPLASWMRYVYLYASMLDYFRARLGGWDWSIKEGYKYIRRIRRVFTVVRRPWDSSFTSRSFSAIGLSLPVGCGDPSVFPLLQIFPLLLPLLLTAEYFRHPYDSVFTRIFVTIIQ